MSAAGKLAAPFLSRPDWAIMAPKPTPFLSKLREIVI